MRNRTVGIIIAIFSVLLGFVIWLFNRALNEIVSDSCSHGPTCPMWGSIGFHTNLSLGIMVAVMLLGVYFIIFSKNENFPNFSDEQSNKDEEKSHKNPEHHHHATLKKFDRSDFASSLKDLDDDEKLIFEKILDKEGTIFQSDLVDETSFTKVKVTRILDKLEGRGLLERRRRGMTNVVILKR